MQFKISTAPVIVILYLLLALLRYAIALESREEKPDGSPGLQHSNAIMQNNGFEVVTQMTALAVDSSRALNNEKTMSAWYSIAAIVSLGMIFFVGWGLTLYKLVCTRKRLQQSNSVTDNLSQKFEQQSRTLNMQEQLLVRLRYQNDNLLDAQTALFGMVSQELKNPITAIKTNFLAWFSKTSFDEVILHRARQVESSILKLEKFCEQADAMAELDSDIHESKTAAFSTIVKSISKEYKESLHSAGITLKTFVEDNFALDGDANNLRTLVSNLIHKAATRASSGDNIRLNLVCRDRTLVLTVSETVFQPNRNLSVADIETADMFDRSDIHQGLELFFARKIAQHHNATISSYTNDKNGTVTEVVFQDFQVIEPQSDNTQIESAKVHFEYLQQPVMEFPGPSSESPRCLVLDADPNMVACIGQCLSKHFNVKGVFNQHNALEQVDGWQPDVVVSEVYCSDGNAFDVLEKIRQRNEVKEIPIIILTTQNTVENRLKALELDIFAFFNKPFSEHLLCKTALKLSSNIRAEQQLQMIKENVPFQQSRDAIFLNQLNSLIENHIDNVDFHFEDYFDVFSLSKRQFFRRVNALTRSTPKQYLINKRLELARHLLGKGVLVEKVARKCGFRDAKSLIKLYEAHFREKVI